MNILKWTILFFVAFAVAWVVIFTFTQEPFTQTVGARIFTMNTPPVPIYAYLIGAFVVGLGLSFIVTIINYFTLKAQIHKKNRQIRLLETDLTALKATTGGIRSGKHDSPNEKDSSQPPEQERDNGFEPQ